MRSLGPGIADKLTRNNNLRQHDSRHEKGSRPIVPDDFHPGEFITVLRNQFRQPLPMGKSVESDYLKGVVLRVAALNLPYVLCQAADPMKGTAMITVDVRDHVFSRVSEEYAEAVMACCCEACDHTNEDDEDDMLRLG